ncbi:ricin-type beta-trefoil lectin domain protein [Streptomyces sp. KK5PA1]|uniref:Ricin-type beta-trefoil lectin domain protein n=1 Tax=Actinacidiphila acididurans TaxID=2784346 RepID=A0ABS2TVD3_9ACTN|nr:ricin-type beta-trefoil lectin domain protein [Actinacidiphila acididurans]
MRNFLHSTPPTRRSNRFRTAAVLTAAAAALAAVAATLTGSTASAAPVRVPAAVAAPAVAAAPTTFTHPGVLVSRSQLDFVRAKVQAGAQPWAAANAQMMASSYASLSRTPKPRATVECGPYSDPNYGCTDERQDAIAAYTDALAWYITQDSRYAQKSIELMNAWARTITGHTNSNAPLQTGWAGSVWPRAAEIIRYTYTGWAPADVTAFSNMLRNVYLPEVINGSNSNGNWELTMMEAAVGISVFLNDSADYDRAITRYLNRVPAYIYLSSDGALPKTVPGSGLDTSAKIISYWQGQSTFVTGLTQETCRDFTHTGYGIASISDVAETAAIQGQDLYPQVGERLRQALGFQSTYELGAAVPSWLCGGTLNRGLGPVTEVGFNALHNRLGYAMSNTQTLTESKRPAGSNDLFVAWETLTNADNPDVIPGGGTTPPTTAPPTTAPPAAPTGPIQGYGGKCVDIAGANAANGTAVQLYDCNGTSAQNWTVGTDSTLRSLGKCMDVAAAGTANGTQIQLYDCNGTGSQMWQPGANGSLVNPQSGKCLDATGPSSANGTRLQIWTCTGAANQNWTLPS